MRIVTRLKGIQAIKKRTPEGVERTLYYHRATKTRLPDDPASPAFVEAWKAAEAKGKPRQTANISAMIDGFKDSLDWKKLRESTRAVMKIHLNAVEAKFGTMPIAALEDRRCRSVFLGWHEEMATAQPRSADARLAALQRVLSWAYDRALVAGNPIDKFHRAYSADRADKIWLPNHVAAMEATAPPEIILAMTLALHTGQRQGDMLKLTWKAFDGAGLSLIQSKTRAKVYIPCTEALLAALVAEKAKDTGSPYILTAASRGAWTSDAFKKAWRAAFEKSKITDDLHFNDLRGTAVTMLAEAGCTTPEIASITGHSLQSATRILEVYLSRTKALATSAIVKLNEHARNKIVNGSVNSTPGKGAK